MMNFLNFCRRGGLSRSADKVAASRLNVDLARAALRRRREAETMRQAAN